MARVAPTRVIDSGLRIGSVAASARRPKVVTKPHMTVFRAVEGRASTRKFDDASQAAAIGDPRNDAIAIWFGEYSKPNPAGSAAVDGTSA